MTPFRLLIFRVSHTFRYGHPPEVALSDLKILCLICDVGTPTMQPCLGA